ncbi:MAG: single-stranded-DNA-specific exonuclease RecJ [Candidatus Marinimicrobia bacterium]|nr:single-stranded-DNA-specific exonuclease RecJ [Candidatus Neomarinimicrobiota bacterium]
MYQWNIKEFNDRQVNKISRNFNIPTVLAKIFIDRGLTSTGSINEFLNPEKQDRHNPFLLKGMKKAVARIKQAKMNNEKVTIYGDYDVDGATSTSLLYLFFQKIGIEAEYYIPDREKEGYGLSKTGIDSIEEESSSLIITCDCGISAIDEVDYANQKNIDIIITDHHTVGDNLPDAFTIVNPKQKDCDYPFPYLAGVGVAFKLAEALAQDFKVGQNFLTEILDLVAIGTAADIVKMAGENRILVAEGLEQIKDTTNPGIKELLSITGLANSKHISVSDIVFRVSPRLNAAGRIASASLAVNLLTTKSNVNAHQLATHLEKLNSKRRSIEDKTINEALVQLNSNYDTEDDKLFLLHKKDWHKGVLGIVASKLIDKYKRPAIMISVDNNDVGVGSARSIPGFDIYEVLSKCARHLENFGGHPRAAGLTVSDENIETLKSKLTEIADEQITKKMLTPTLNIDSVIKFNQINQRTISVLKKLAPFGPSNMKPIFVAENVSVSGIPRIVGKNHLKFRAIQNKIVISAIGWKLANLYEMLISNRPLNIAFVIEENRYNGMKEIQLNIKDIKYAD